MNDDIKALKAALATIDSVPMSSIPKNMMVMVLTKKCDMYKQITDKLIAVFECNDKNIEGGVSHDEKSI